TEQYDSIEDMIENGLTGLDFSDLVSVPDEVIDKHTGKDEQTVDLMSDAADISDTSSPAEDVPAVTLKYKGDSESLDEIKDKALSLGATVIIDNAEGVISIDTYENHTAELDGLAYELGIMRVDDTPARETEEIDDDAPLFSDADVIEQIQADEKADTPFWETPDVQGEQLSLFGDPEPIQQTKPEKPKSEFAKGPFVDGVQVYEALAAEIDRGTGFQNGKLRVQDFFDEQHPTIQQLADFLKKEYGIGGHTGEGNISHVHYDGKGLTFDFENGEKFRHSWYNVASMTDARLKTDSYLSAEQRTAYEQMKADKAEEQTAENPETHNKVEIGDKFRNKLTGEICEVVSLEGALPYYTDDCTVQRDSGGFMVTENISYDKLLNSGLYEYIGKTEQEKEQPEAVKPEPVRTDEAHEAEKPEIPTVKNLSQLKKALKPGMMFEITDHLRPECIGERRMVTGVNTVEFTSRKLDENGDPTGKDIYMEFGRAKNWSFDGGELTSRLDNGDMVMSFHFIDSLERTKEPEREPISENVIADNISEQEKAAPELSVGDIIEYKGKEYKVESLDTDGFITLNDTSFSGAVKDRVTFIADEFLQNAEYSIVTPDAPTTDKGDNFTITDDSLGEGGAKSKFRANVDAIRTLKTLEAENRPATAEEMETLSRYVGWGAIPQAFDKRADKWSAEYKELSELLTPEEYRQARSTVGDAFYTSPTIIEGIYEALGNFGFEGGNVLEPAMGVGNFFGCMPKEMQDGSHLYGVEIDSISGRIAQALYPNADIAIQGFEKNSFQNGCFDVAVGNVPFGELGFKDEKHSTSKLHDYFFMEAMDKLKNGGVMAFVTSAGTLDKRDESVRQMLADKADLIGAIRLPGGKNGAFKDNAGTEVTTDIIFLQKHEGKSVAEMSDIPDWVHIGETADGLPINKYFEQHPDMVLGTVVEGNKLYGSGTMVVAEDGFDLKSALHEAVSKLSAEISPDKARDVYAKTEQGLAVKIPSDLRNFSFFMQDDQIFFKKNAVSFEQRFDKKNAQFGRYKAFIELRDITRELIQAQELNKPDSVIADLQTKLNTSYDDFYKKYGLIHSKTNKRYFNEDISYNLVAGLEKKIDKDKLVEKSDIFTKRTICPPKAVECVETAMEALTLSIAEKARVDFEYMSKLTGLSEDELKHDLVGEIYKIPHTENTYQTASEYLSGDIRAKLREAEEVAEYDADFNINVNALQKAMPEPLKAGDIDVKIGATWLDPKYYNQFMYELLSTDDSNRADKYHARWFKPKLIEAEYSEHSNSWFISNKKADRSVLVNQKYGSPKMNAYEIFEHLLNLKEPKIYKTIEVPDGMGDTKEKRVVDIDATRVVQKKAKEMRKAFKAWIFKDPERREAIVQRYNELFNSVRPREYDGSSLSFPMMNSSIHLHDHQKNAIAHAMFGGNTLFAHSVGAGKTFEMIATAMESKRLGLCTKSLFAVPNHLTEQIGDDFQRLYPSANILVATKKDFQKANRQQLFAKIATGNYDAVIIGHSQLGMIPVSKERQTMTIQSQIDDILEGIEELKKHEGSKFQIKAMERTRKSLQKQLDKLQKMNQDETLTFEQLGIDKLFVDECHEFKNLFTPSKMTNIAGISNSASQKALDLFLKCRYLDEKTGGRGITYATGTPLSNSVTELHTMMRYLEYDFLKDHGLQHFDNWVSVFGEQRTDWELAPAGNRFKERTRIATFSGLPELMSMFKQVADIRTADTLDLDVPDCEYKV
ncbi:MAG: DEAD/DEAH box helicase family protein, partial [Ruminococcus sp.]|nr:DEAD/DEAH box helicase family protein [Ruminococcus sp.]